MLLLLSELFIKPKIWCYQHTWTLRSFYQPLLLQSLSSQNPRASLRMLSACKVSFWMQLVTRLIMTFYISRTLEGSQITSGFEANRSSAAETGTWTQSHIMEHWKRDISLKLQKGVWKLYIFLLIIFHFCVILHLVFLCRSRRVKHTTKKTTK